MTSIMQDDYIALYEAIREQVSVLEASWRDLQSQLRQGSFKGCVGHNNLSETMAARSNSAMGRRIKPTLLREEVRVPNLLDGTVVDEEGADSAFHRPIRSISSEQQPNHHVQPVTAWKPVPPPPIVVPVVTRPGPCQAELFGYFHQGLDQGRMNHLQQFSSAFTQIVFEEVAMDFNFVGGFPGALVLILKILVIGNEFISVAEGPSSMTSLESFLLKPLPKTSKSSVFAAVERPLDMFWFSLGCLEASRDRISILFPDLLKSLEKCRLIEILAPKLLDFLRSSQKANFSATGGGASLSSTLGSSSGGSISNSLPVAYSNQRDSRNFFTDPSAHANQQKARDLFLNLIRHFASSSTTLLSNQFDPNHPNFRRNFGGRVAEVVGKLGGRGENFVWLAELFLREFEQTMEVRIELLEERLAGARGHFGSGLDQIFYLFLEHADSLKLTRAVERKLIGNIAMLMVQLSPGDRRRSTWPEIIRKLRSFIKLIAFCRYKLDDGVDEEKNSGIKVDEEDLLVFSWTQEAILNRHLVNWLPLIYDYFSVIGEESIKSRCGNTCKLLIRYHQVKFESKPGRGLYRRLSMILRLALEDLFRDLLPADFYADCMLTMREESLNDEAMMKSSNDIKSPSKSGETLFMDEDDLLPVSSVYRTISSQLRRIHSQFTLIATGLNTGSAGVNGSADNTAASATNATGTPRKIRPVTEVTAVDFKRQRLQKQLRQWFWWRYGSQKDLIDALNVYVLEQLLFPQFPRTQPKHPTPADIFQRKQNMEVCKNLYKEVLRKLLPELLPAFWRDQEEMQTLLLGLSVELASKAIQRHFSWECSGL